MADGKVIPLEGYYGRQGAVHLDGTPIFATEEDRRHEAEVAALIASHWACSIRLFGALSAVDWYAERHGRLIGVLELKSRSHALDRYPTVFLNVRKWLALTLARVGLGVPALFVVRFTDQLRWVPLSAIDPNQVRIAGCNRLVKSHSDIEPVIEVPVADLRSIDRLYPVGTA
jgi:hypothetical protein